MELLREAAKDLRTPPEKEATQVVGLVRAVSTDGIPDRVDDRRQAREIEINWATKDSKLVKVKVHVTPSEYLKAVEAHTRGQSVVISGDLPKTGKTRSMEKPGRLRVIEG